VFKRMFHRKRQSADFTAEIQAHIQLEEERLREHGLSPEEAHNRAYRAFGNVTHVQERFYESRHWLWLDHLLQDVRFAARMLRKSPGFTLVAVLTLALGIGASTVGFSIFYNLAFNAFAAKNASRLVVPTIHDIDSGNSESLSLSLDDFKVIRDQNHVFENVVGYITDRGLVLASDGPHMYQFFVSRVTSDAFDFYGVPALIGRGIEPADGNDSAPPVFVMSYKTWRDEFNADPSILGRNFTVDGEPRTLVGVMPPRFQAFGSNGEIWLPITPSMAQPQGAFGHFQVQLLARLKPGVSLEAAAADLDVIEKGLAADHPSDFPKHFRAGVETAENDLIGARQSTGPGFHSDIKHLLYDLLAAVMMLLLIACCNVANLLLARASAREKEIAVRSALGASRGRIVRQLLVESSILTIASCVVGCIFAWASLKIIVAFLPNVFATSGGWGRGIGLEALLALGLNWPVLLFAMGITIVTTLICGLAPAVHMARVDLQPQMAGAGKSGASAHGKLRSMLVFVEVALSIVLLIGTGLMMRTLFLLTHVDLGFNPKNVLLVLFLPPPRELKVPTAQIFASPEGRAVLQNVADRLKVLPGVTNVSIEESIPGFGPSGGPQVTLPGGTHTEEAMPVGCDENFLDTLQMRLLRGRWLSGEEVRNAADDVVVNQKLAHGLFGNASPLGKQIEVRAFQSPLGAPQDTDFQVVGVVADIKNVSPQDPSTPLIFVPYTVRGGFALLLKTAVNPATLSRAVKQTIWSVDQDEVVALSDPLEKILQKRTYSTPEFGLTLSAPLASIALLLVVAGVFSVMAYTVSLQTHEIGIRMALGAQQENILRMVLMHGSRLVAAGIFVGVLASLELTRFVASQIWGISPTDPATFIGVAILLTLVALAACYVPARRAANVDPLTALRSE
jgi:putative ABC transport system permease protein